MNLASVLQKDKTEIGAGFFEPYQVVTLLDLLEFNAENFLEVCVMLALIGRPLSEPPPETEDDRIRALAWFERIEPQVERLRDLLVRMELRGPAKAADDLLNRPRPENKESQVKMARSSADHLIRGIRDDLKGRNFMMLPLAKVQYYDDPTCFFSAEIREISSSADEEITEACKCFALNRYTACIFHLMRLMERYLQAWAQTVGFTLESTYDKEWQKIINNIRGKLKTLYPSDKDPQRIKEESRLGHFETVKIAWRNPTMHPKQTYTEEEAKEIMNAIKAFARSFIEADHKEHE